MTELDKSAYNLGRVYALLQKQGELTDEQTLLFEELKNFRSALIEMDYKLYGVFEIAYVMEMTGK